MYVYDTLGPECQGFGKCEDGKTFWFFNCIFTSFIAFSISWPFLLETLNIDL